MSVGTAAEVQRCLISSSNPRALDPSPCPQSLAMRFPPLRPQNSAPDPVASGVSQGGWNRKGHLIYQARTR